MLHQIHKILCFTHDGTKLFMGVDMTGLHVYLTRTPKPTDPPDRINSLTWHVQKFPLELYEIIKEIMNGKETFGSFQCGDIVGQVHEVIRNIKIKLELGDIENGWSFEIYLNGDELAKLQEGFTQHFCY